ncbi:hypothetical protein [Pedobacter suwonensis]|uniref:hypothetical protein n=2 Tax=Pedobacter suwonensis TaxID=332999 RepID=UPI003D020EE3
MLSPSELYSYESGYFFYTSDKRYFNIYFSVYTIELEENGALRSEDKIMIGLSPIPGVPQPYTEEELGFSNGKPRDEINTAMVTAIKKFFNSSPKEILLYLLSTQKGQQAARKKRFASIVDQLGEEITCYNYEFDNGFPDNGFLVLTNNPDSEAIKALFDEYVKQFSNE